ncbi:MAG: hypothetical protein ACYCOU_25630 [Sulfobacillus sp.]
MQIPKRLDFSQQDIEALFKRIEASQLDNADQALLKQVIEFSCWLQQGLETSEVNVPLLRKLFGILAEKKSLL